MGASIFRFKPVSQYESLTLTDTNARQKGNRDRFSRIDMKRDLSWRNYTSPDLTANLDLDPVIDSTRFALAAFFAGSIFTARSPNLLAACAHEGQTSIFSRTTPPSCVVT